MHKNLFFPFLRTFFAGILIITLWSFKNQAANQTKLVNYFKNDSTRNAFNDLYTHISETAIYPKIAREEGVSGRVVAVITIKNNKVESAKIIRGIGNGCDEEVVKVIRAFKNDLTGVKPGVYYLPVVFRFKEDATLNAIDTSLSNSPNYLNQIVISAGDH